MADRPHQLLDDVHTALQRLPAPGAELSTAVSSKDVSCLRDAVAALSKCSAPSNETPGDSLGQWRAAVQENLELLVQLLLEPSQQLYGGLGGAPCEPGPELSIVGITHQEAVVAQLQLLLLLLHQLGPLELPAADDQAAAAAPEKEDGRERNRPRYVVGIVEIVEEEDSSSTVTAEQQVQAQLQQLVLQVLQVCALYGSSQQEQAPLPAGRSSSSNTAAPQNGDSRASTQQSSSVCDLDTHCARVVQQGMQLLSPWSSSECQQQCEQILQHVALHVAPPAAAAAAGKAGQTGRSRQQQGSMGLQVGCNSDSKQQEGLLQAPAAAAAGGEPAVQQQQQQQQWQQDLQQLLSALLPQLLDCLRDTLMAQHRHRKAQDRGELGAYKGPDTFRRCLAACQLAWLVQQLQPPALASHAGLLLPLVLAVADDPSPAVQRYGHAALAWMANSSSDGSHGAGEVLRWQRVLLLDVARRLVVGCEESCWASAMPAATALVLVLEGRNMRAAGYHDFLQELITEAERNAHKPQQRLIFMGCIARLIPCLGLYLTRYFAQLMPLLLEWTHAYDEQSVVVAVQVLGRVVQHAWPRMRVHAGVLLEHLVEVAKAAEERQWMKVAGLERQQQQQVDGWQQQQVEGHQQAPGQQHQGQQCGTKRSTTCPVRLAVLHVVELLAKCGV